MNDPRGLELIRIVGPRMVRTAALIWNRDANRTVAALAFANIIRSASLEEHKPGHPR